MALNGYVLHVDLSDIRELVSLQRRSANNLNQVAIHVNTYGGIYPHEIKALQRDYADLWGGVFRSSEKAVQDCFFIKKGRKKSCPFFSYLFYSNLSLKYTLRKGKAFHQRTL